MDNDSLGLSDKENGHIWKERHKVAVQGGYQQRQWRVGNDFNTNVPLFEEFIRQLFLQTGYDSPDPSLQILEEIDHPSLKIGVSRRGYIADTFEAEGGCHTPRPDILGFKVLGF